jgi:hypothetical protein
MRASGTVRQRIAGSFQISGSCRPERPLPGFWKTHARWTRYRLERVCFARGCGKGNGARCDWLSAHICADDAEEVQVHIGSAILIIWLVIGGFAAGQRGDYKEAFTCSGAATAATTILAGPLNYTGVDPHINCTAPNPSN